MSQLRLHSFEWVCRQSIGRYTRRGIVGNQFNIQNQRASNPTGSHPTSRLKYLIKMQYQVSEREMFCKRKENINNILYLHIQSREFFFILRLTVSHCDTREYVSVLFIVTRNLQALKGYSLILKGEIISTSCQLKYVSIISLTRSIIRRS